MRRLTMAVLALGAVALPQAASAAVLDLGSVTCKELLAGGKEDIGYTAAWLDGYYKDEDDPAVIDFDRLKEKAVKLGEYCGAHPDVGVGTAAEALFGK